MKHDVGGVPGGPPSYVYTQMCFRLENRGWSSDSSPDARMKGLPFLVLQELPHRTASWAWSGLWLMMVIHG
jgi:hypothetical protein